MKQPDSLLALTDFSEHAAHATARAARIATEQDAALRIAHVVSAGGLTALRDLLGGEDGTRQRLLDSARLQLDALAGKMPPAAGARIATEVRVGSVLEEILALAANADLLVAGARGESRMRELMLGSTAERLLGKCTRPILVVKRPSLDTYRRVLVPVDFSAFSAPALAAAARLAPQADIHVCHAFSVPFEGQLRIAGASEDHIFNYRAQARRRALDEIHALIAQVDASKAARFNPVIEHGDAPIMLFEQQSRRDADLIVIGKHGHSFVEDLLLGSVTRHVLSEAQCDVLVIAAPGP